MGKASSTKKEYVLRVKEAKKYEATRGKVRIPERVMRKISVEPGDVITIVGRRTTVAITWPAFPEDESEDIIRMDGIVRKNAEVSVDEKIIVKPADVKPATQVKLSIGTSTIEISRSESSLKAIKRRLLDYAVVEGDIVPLQLLGSLALFYVVQTRPTGPVIITEKTKLIILDKSSTLMRFPKVTYEDIGGMKHIIERVRELVELPLKHPELFRKLGIEPPKGILLYGPPGCGKTLLAKAVATESDAYFIAVNGPEIMSKFYGESEQRLREIFEDAKKHSPAIIFIDEIDAIAPKRDEVIGEVERRVVAQLLTLMDGLEGRGDVIVIGATNRPHGLDPALRRPGRYDREIEIPLPDKQGRLEILQIHTRNAPLAKDVVLKKLAEVTHGFTGADLASLVKEAAMNALRRALPGIDLEEDVPPQVLESLQITMEDFVKALKDVSPSGLREVLVEVPEVRWGDVGGLDEVKQQLREAIEWPLKSPEVFEGMGIHPPKGILLYGPPGCGKTLLAKAVATESEANFIAVKGPEILSKWVGESEKAVREIFRRARQVSPAVVFFDEIDSIAPARGFRHDSGVTDRIVNQLLSELDGIQTLKNVVVIGATNRADIVDSALLRPGRFDRIIYVPPPDKKARYEILKVHTKNVPLDKDVDLLRIAELTNGYSGADLEALVREAAVLALRERFETRPVSMKYFLRALEVVKPSLTKDLMEKYQKTYESLKRMVM